MKPFLVLFNCCLGGCMYAALTEPIHAERALIVTGAMLAMSASIAALATLLAIGVEWGLTWLCGKTNAVDLD